MSTNAKGLFIASIIFLTIIVVIIGVSSFFSPGPLLFSDDFGNATRNQQFPVCPGFTIVEERLRVTVEDPYMGRAITLVSEYEEFVFTIYVRPVGDVHDGSVNIFFGQASDHSYEIQYRPEKEKINFTETATNTNQEKTVVFTTGWVGVPEAPFNDSGNKVKLVVTRRSFDLWVSDVEVFRYRSPVDFPYFKGRIGIGAGAGEAGGVTFEFDNIEIHKPMPFVRRFHDYLIEKEFEKDKDISSQNGLCLDCNLPFLGLVFSKK